MTRSGSFPPAAGYLLGRVLLLVAMLACVGCEPGDPVVRKVAASYDQLKTIAEAYEQATTKLARPPENFSELKPFLKHVPDPEKLLRSPDEAEEYIVVWGVDYRKRVAGGAEPVIAYEKNGKNGQRFVVQGRNITVLKDEEFRKVPFPRGHKPPP